MTTVLSELVRTVALDPQATIPVWAALYVRISQDPEGLEKGVRRQINNGIEQLRTAGATHVHIYCDNDISASRHSRKRRDEYWHLLDALEAGQYQIIGVRMEDRMHRQVIELAKFLQICEKAGVTRFVSGMGEFNLADPGQRTTLYIKAALAEAEVEAMRHRQLDAQAEMAKRGQQRRGGWRAFGEPGVNKHVAHKDPEIALQIALQERIHIREAAADIVAGRSLGGIAREWEAKGIATPNGKVFKNNVIRRLLISPRMIGMREYQGSLYGDGSYAILERHVWEQVRTILTDPRRLSQGRGKPTPYLMTGVLYCGLCGTRMRTEIKPVGKRPGGPRIRYYRCKKEVGSPACGKFHCSAEPLEKLLVSVLFEAVESPDFYELGSPDHNPAQELYEQLVRLNALRERIEDKVAREVISEKAGQRNVAEVDREIEQVKSKLALIDANRVKIHMPRNLREVWDDFSIDRKRAIMAAVFERIVVYPQQPGPFDPHRVVIEKWRA